MYVLPFGQMSLWGNNLALSCSSIPLSLSSGLGLGVRELNPNKKFMGMFVGLVDGDGYIEIGPQKQYNKSVESTPKSTIRARLVIRLHSRDKAFLTSLTKVLGAGSISSLPSVNQTRLIFSKRDLVAVIIPLMKQYNLQFLTGNRARQFALLNHIIDNQIVHWENVTFNPSRPVYSLNDLVSLSFFADWVVGFTIAEGSFGHKSNGSAFYQIKQKGLENYVLIKAICLIIAGREAKPVKADTADCYQLTLSSKLDVQKAVDFFSSPANYPLSGYKLEQYNVWIAGLRKSARYHSLINLNEINRVD